MRNARVDCRELASPRAAPRLHVEEVVEEPPVSARVRLLSLGSVPEELERRRDPADRFLSIEELPLDAHGAGGEREADGGDARRPTRGRLVGNEARGRIELVQEVPEGLLLELVAQRGVVDGRLHRLTAHHHQPSVKVARHMPRHFVERR